MHCLQRCCISLRTSVIICCSPCYHCDHSPNNVQLVWHHNYIFSIKNSLNNSFVYTLYRTDYDTTHGYNFPFILYTNVFNLVKLPTKMKPIACSFIYECMNKNLAAKLPQCQLNAVNPNTTPFAVLDQYGGVEPLILPKKLDCIKFIFSTPQNISCKSP